MVACSGGGKDRGERIVREFGMIMYTLIYLKCITNKDLLYRAGNCAQCYVAAWRATVHGVATSRTQLSGFTFTFHFHALEKEMATHSSVLGWRIPGTGEPGGLLSMGSHRVGHD